MFSMIFGMTRLDVEFLSKGVRCAAWLFVPEGADKAAAANGGAAHGGVVLAHGMGAVKEMFLDRFGEAFAAAGLVALAFDYRHYGGSEGEPRELLIPALQQEDYKNAITWLARHPLVDANRIGVWGTSFSGGHVLHLAAFDRRIKAAVAQVPAVDLWANAQRVADPALLDSFVKGLAEARAARYPTDEPQRFPFSAPTGEVAFQSDDETHDWLIRTRDERAPAYVNEVVLESFEHILSYTPGMNTHRIGNTPVLVVLAEEDRWTPNDLVREAMARMTGPTKLLTVPGGHYSVYDGPGHTEAAQAATTFFVEHLGSNQTEVLV
jgi:uncharacterized protein